MLGIGPGSTLAGRYAVRERRAVGPGWERWSAIDSTLDSEVEILAIPSDSPHAAAALDAARRAAAATDPRLTQVLDASGPTSPAPVTDHAAGGASSVSADAGATVHYVIESAHPGARSLRSILGDGPIPDDEARRIAGEVAMALTEAGRLGLHHGSLDLGAVLIDPKGAVIVRGMATEAALRGLDPTGDEVTSADARAIVAILYAALTTRWPLSPAPAVDTLEARADDDDAPRGDADHPAPRIDGVLVPPSDLVPGVPPDLDASVDEVLGRDARPLRPQDIAALLRPWSAYPLVDLHSDLRRESAIDLLSLRTDRAAGSPRATPPRTTPGLAAGQDAAQSAGQSPGQSAGQPGAPTPQPPKHAVGHAPDSPTEPGAHPIGHAPEPPAEPLFEDAAISQVLSRAPIPEAAADPILPELGAPNRKESRLALGLIGGLVLILALLGIWGVSRMGASGSHELPNPTSHTTSRPTGSTATGSTGAEGTASDPAATAALTPVAVAGSSAYEPQNGGSVASRTAPRAYDGKVDTSWQSNAWYQSDKFGGLPIPGLGLVLDVGAPTPIREVTVTVPAAQDFTVLVGTAPTPDGATTIGSVTGQSGQHTFSVPADTADARYVIVYVTRLGLEGTRFRAQVAEVAIAR